MIRIIHLFCVSVISVNSFLPLPIDFLYTECYHEDDTSVSPILLYQRNSLMSMGGDEMRQTVKNVSPFSNQARNAYVIEHITDSLLKLLRDKPIGDISISELCDLAGIGRASFYRNFESKEGILRGYINKIFKEWTDEADRKENRALNELLGLMFAHFEKHRDFYSLLNERNLVYLLKDVIIGLCGPKPEHSKVEAYARAYVAYTLYGWIEVWFQRGMQETAEEIAGMFQAQGF